MLRYLLFLLLILHSWLGYTQRPQLRHYTTEDGLPSNTVYYILQDSRGFMWFCTDWGVCRFDGHHFKKITSNDGLLDNEVFRMYEDPWRRIWVSSYNGSPVYIHNDRVYSSRNDTLCRYLEKNDLRYTGIFSNPDRNFNVSGLRNSKAGEETSFLDMVSKTPHYQFTDKGISYWVGHKNIIRKDHTKLTTVLKLKRGYISAACYLGGHFYAGVYKNDSFTVKSFYDIVFNEGVPKVKEIKTSSRIVAVTAGKNGKMWYCTSNGIFEYDPDGNHASDDRIVAIKGVFSYYCFVDKQGNCWYATNQGVYMQPANAVEIYTALDGLKNDNVYTIAYMPGRQLLAGYENGDISIREDESFQPLYHLGGGYWSRIKYLLPTGKHTFYAGTDMGLYQGNLQQRKYVHVTTGAQKSGALRKGMLLISRNDGMYGNVALYNTICNRLEQLPALNTKMQVTATAIAPDGTYWLGTSQGLYFYRDNTIRKLAEDSTLSHSRITSLNMLGDKLVISTHSDGLFARDGSRMIRLNKSNGLNSNITKKAYVDEKERVWVNTDKGLSRITFQQDLSYSVYHFSAADGIPDYMINDIAFGDGKAYLATSKGIIIVNQDQTSTSLPYKVYILKVSYKDSVVNYPDRIVLNYQQNNVQVTYTAISYTEGQDITYKYLLRGAGKDTVMTVEGTLNLGALEPGNYELMVWAAGKNNNWNKKPALLSITVKPPFWKETWFVIGLACLLMLLLVLVYKWRIRTIQKKEMEKAGRKRVIAELEMQALRAQINPHFMFNALNAIQNYYNKNDELGANYYMASFARLIRQTLTFSKEHWNTISGEMSMLNTYIELEQMRLRQRFSYELHVDPAVEQCKIPTMLLQTYVENAINHGLRNLKEDNGKLLISCRRHGDTIVCVVEDNGVGFEMARKLDSRPGDYRSMGLKITANRIAVINELYGTSITTQITDKQCSDKDIQGTIVTITINNVPAL